MKIKWIKGIGGCKTKKEIGDEPVKRRGVSLGLVPAEKRYWQNQKNKKVSSEKMLNTYNPRWIRWMEWRDVRNLVFAVRYTSCLPARRTPGGPSLSSVRRVASKNTEKWIIPAEWGVLSGSTTSHLVTGKKNKDAGRVKGLKWSGSWSPHRGSKRIPFSS